MVLAANEYPSTSVPLLEMAFKAERGVAFGEHARIDGTVRPVARGAPLAHRFVFEYERASLRDMTFATRVLFGRKSGAAADDGLTFVGIVAIRASDSLACSHSAAVRAFQYRMSMRQTEFTAFVEVALETRLWRAIRIDNGVCGASGFFVDTPGSVAGFAAHVHSIGPGCLQFGVGGCQEIGMNVCVALGACLRAHKRSARNLRRSNHGTRHGRAGKEHHGGNGRKGNSNRSPGKTPLGRCLNVRNVSAHEFPSLNPNNSADDQSTASQKPRVNNLGHFTAQPSSPARIDVRSES